MMKQRSKQYQAAFRIAFVLLAGATLLLLAWQCAQRPPATSRVAWPPPAPTKP
jgi:hypothetical protein